MNINMYDFQLPIFPEESRETSFHGLDDESESFTGLMKTYNIYKNILNILYPNNVDVDEYLKIISSKDSGIKNPRLQKKTFLLDILQNHDPDDNVFKDKLQRILPNGINYNHICSDEEYENLVAEFE